jgi:transposase InsO family protein
MEELQRDLPALQSPIIDVVHIQPGKPIENAQVERFHGRLWDECLNVSWFWNVFDARRRISGWQREYNCQRNRLDGVGQGTGRDHDLFH